MDLGDPRPGRAAGPTRRPAAFDPDAPADFAANPACAAFAADPSRWPRPAPTTSAWLGEAIEIKPATTAMFENFVRSNLLIDRRRGAWPRAAAGHPAQRRGPALARRRLVRDRRIRAAVLVVPRLLRPGGGPAARVQIVGPPAALAALGPSPQISTRGSPTPEQRRSPDPGGSSWSPACTAGRNSAPTANGASRARPTRADPARRARARGRHPRGRSGPTATPPPSAPCGAPASASSPCA